MRNKLYYDCPIEAAYMAKNFGVKSKIHSFLDRTWVPDNGKEQFKWSSDPLDIVEMWPLDFYSKEWSIHPDSLDIFEGKVGDIIRQNEATGEIVGIVGDFLDIMQIGISHGMPCDIGVDFGKIILRNDKPFIMPKEEA